MRDEIEVPSAPMREEEAGICRHGIRHPHECRDCSQEFDASAATQSAPTLTHDGSAHFYAENFGKTVSGAPTLEGAGEKLPELESRQRPGEFALEFENRLRRERESQLIAALTERNAAVSRAEKAEGLLGDVSHLWLDGYIEKNPNSFADESVSKVTFEEIERFLRT